MWRVSRNRAPRGSHIIPVQTNPYIKAKRIICKIDKNICNNANKHAIFSRVFSNIIEVFVWYVFCFM